MRRCVNRVSALGLVLAVGTLCAGNAWAQDTAPLSLADAIVRARSASPELQSARASAEGSSAAVAAFGRLDNPSLELRAENWGTASSAAGVLMDTFAVTSQPLPFGGRRRAQRDVLAAESAAAIKRVAPSQLALDLEVSRRYIDAVTARDQLAQFEDHETSVAELTRIVESRVAAGAAPESDGARLRGELVRVRQLRMQARLELIRRTAALNGILGDGPGIDPAQLVMPAPGAAPSLSADALISTLVDTHPAVVDARARLEVSRRTIRFEEAVGRLSATAIGGYKRTSGISSGVAAVVLTLPIFDTNGAAKARAASGERLAELSVVQAERTALADMRSLLETVRLAAHALDDASGLESLDMVRTAARARLRESAADVLGVVDAERLWHDTRRDRQALQREALHAVVELRIRLGMEIQP